MSCGMAICELKHVICPQCIHEQYQIGYMDNFSKNFCSKNVRMWNLQHSRSIASPTMQTAKTLVTGHKMYFLRLSGSTWLCYWITPFCLLSFVVPFLTFCMTLFCSVSSGAPSEGGTGSVPLLAAAQASQRTSSLCSIWEMWTSLKVQEPWLLMASLAVSLAKECLQNCSALLVSFTSELRSFKILCPNPF